MSNTITFEVPPAVAEFLKSVDEKLSRIEALLKIEKYDERDFVRADEFITRNRIGRKTLYKRVKEGKIEVDDSLGVKRYRKVLS